MYDKYASLEILEEKHIVSILMFLSENGDSLKSEIYRNVSTNPRMPIKLNLLEEIGLIHQTVDRFRNNMTTVSLTVKGRMVVRELITVDLIILEMKSDGDRS